MSVIYHNGVPYWLIAIILTGLLLLFVIWFFLLKEEAIIRKVFDVSTALSDVSFYFDDDCTKKINSSPVNDGIYLIKFKKYQINNQLYAKQKGYKCTEVQGDETILRVKCEEQPNSDICSEKWNR